MAIADSTTRQEAEKVRRLRTMRSGFLEEGRLHEFLRDAYAGIGGFRNGQVPSPSVTFWGMRSYERGWSANNSWWNQYVDARAAFNDRKAGTAPGPARQSWSYIQPFPGEDNFTYLDRVNNSNYVNNVQPIVRVTNSFLTREDAQRIEVPEELAEWIKCVTTDKKHIQEHAKNVCWRGQLVGWCATLVDLPDIQTANLSDSERIGLRPYLTTYWPQEVWDYDASSTGEINGIKFVREHEVERKSMLDDKEYVQEIVVWSKTGWERYLISVPGPRPETGQPPQMRAKMNKIISATSGDNPFIDPETGLGVVPVAFFRWDEALDGLAFTGQPQILALAQIARKHYNQQSELDYMMRSQVFGQLVGPINSSGAAGAVQGTINVGYGNFLPEPTDAKGIWRYISPDGKCAESYENALERNKRDGYRISLIDVGESKQAETAEGRKLRFQQTDAMLAAAAENLDRWEKSVLWFVSFIYKIEPEVFHRMVVRRKRDYSIISLLDAIEGSMSVLKLDIGVEANVAIISRMVLTQIPDVSESKSLEIQAQIRAEVTRRLGKTFNLTGSEKSIDALVQEFQWISVVDHMDDGTIDVAVSAERVADLTKECTKRKISLEAKELPVPPPPIMEAAPVDSQIVTEGKPSVDSSPASTKPVPKKSPAANNSQPASPKNGRRVTPKAAQPAATQPE